MTALRHARLTTLGAALSLAGAIVLHLGSPGRVSSYRGPADEELYVRSGSVLKRMALSYDVLLADVYWIRAVQYFGQTRLDTRPGKSYGQLYPLLDITTTLDPQFHIAYRFGAVFLAEAYPNGPGQPYAAIALLKKGYAANPGRWQYLQDIGFIYYWWLRDYLEAAHWFERAHAVRGAPEWLAPLAAVTLTRGGDRAGARELWEQLLQTGDHAYLRRIAEHRLVQLRVLDELDALNATLARFRQTTGGAATTWTPMAAAGWVPYDPPLDPAGVPYVIDPTTGRATVSDRSPYHPLPVATEPPPASRPPS